MSRLAAALVVAGMLVPAGRAHAQALPFDWNNRTLVGASYVRFNIDQARQGAGLIALHATHLGSTGVEPDFMGAVYAGGGGFAIVASLGIGPFWSTPDVMFSLSGGPGTLFVGEFLVNLQASFGMVIRAGSSLGIRLGAQHQWYVFNTNANGVGAWILEAGITGLGQST